MKILKFYDKEYKIDIKVKSIKIEVATSTYFQRFALWIFTISSIEQKTKTEILIKLNSYISEARAQYDKIKSEAWAQYDKIKSEAWAQYDKIDSEAWAQYDKTKSEARAQYDKIKSKAWAQYDKIDSEARAQYQEKITIKIKELIKEYKLDFKEG